MGDWFYGQRIGPVDIALLAEPEGNHLAQL